MNNVFLILNICLFIGFVYLVIMYLKYKNDYLAFKKTIKDDQFLLMKNEKIIYNELNKLLSISRKIEYVIYSIRNKINSSNKLNNGNADVLKGKMNEISKTNDNLILEIKYLKHKLQENDTHQKRDI